MGLTRGDSGSGKQYVCPLSEDDGFYFLVKYIVVQSMTERQRNPDKPPALVDKDQPRPTQGQWLPPCTPLLCPLCNKLYLRQA